MQFKPVARTGKSVPVMLIEFSRENSIPTKLLDFELISYKTFIQRPNEDYISINNVKEITETDIKNSNTIIEQEYKIKIFPKAPQAHLIKIGIAVNDSKTQAIIKIGKGSIFEQRETLLKEIIDRVYYLKLRAGLFIELFEEGMKAQLQKLLQVVPYGKPIGKDLKIQVALGLIPTKPIHAHIERIFEENKEKENLISGVHKGDLVLRYVKDKFGMSGRSCNGQYLEANDPKILQNKPKIDITIKEKETDAFIEYFADMDGHVSYINDELRIKKILHLNSADIKAFDNLDAGEDNKDIKIDVKHNKSEIEDAIDTGVNVKVKELNVSGSIGDNVKIQTEDLNIDAQTHKKSTMQVENVANIKLHRGDLQAKEAYVDVLESGQITCSEYAHVKRMLGGKIIAPTVVVDEVLSNVTIVASKLIEVGSITGENNKLRIDPDSIKVYHDKLVILEERKKELTLEIKEDKKLLDLLTKDHKSKVHRIQQWQKNILQATKAGKTPMKQDVIRVKQFKKETETLKEKEENIVAKEKEIVDIEAELHMMYNQDLHGEIKVKTSFDGHTKVEFMNIKTKEVISYLPEGKYQSISLVADQDEERSLKLT